MLKLGTLTVIASMATCLAQGPGGLPPRDGASSRFDDLRVYLGLTEAQVRGLQQILQQEMRALQSIHEEIGQKQSALRDQLRSGHADPAALGRLLLEIEGLKARVLQARSGFQAQARNLLTETQKTKLNKLEEAAALDEEIRQAVQLHLLAPPEGEPAGPIARGGGPGGRRGPGFGR